MMIEWIRVGVPSVSCRQKLEAFTVHVLRATLACQQAIRILPHLTPGHPSLPLYSVRRTPSISVVLDAAFMEAEGRYEVVGGQLKPSSQRTSSQPAHHAKGCFQLEFRSKSPVLATLCLALSRDNASFERFTFGPTSTAASSIISTTTSPRTDQGVRTFMSSQAILTHLIDRSKRNVVAAYDGTHTHGRPQPSLCTSA